MRLSIGISTALQSRSRYSMLNTATEKTLKSAEIGAVAGGEVVDRLGGEGDGVQDDESDDEGVDDAAGGMGVAADFENVVDLPPPMAPDGLGAHALGASRAALGLGIPADRAPPAILAAIASSACSALAAVGAAGLREVGAPASALAAEGFGADPRQLDGIVAVRSDRR